MTTYTIPRKDHQFLYIIEGSLLSYTLKNDELHIIVNCVDYPDFPQEIPMPNYSEWVRIKFKQFSYLKFIYVYATKSQDKKIKNVLELGELKQDDEILDYGGTLELIGGRYDLPTGFSIDIVCREIELEFLDQESFNYTSHGYI
ncbi:MULTISPECIES: hypothetical protein [Neisseria]|jgi:hypothetical protein|uniref:Uncharacterized protein n=1 Tax=Neisseria mucosa (strain ATCC 25996 / DSM 4631 / NCTC 10774 / M26) TaxID=546266 RepID=D2ZWL4_NEIM2|nr:MULTISPECIES: hypothetical protein [Neisseria]EFC88628.1 hypothetical protein NEIMUCOT_05011 [Neisseria mucosa ATCC 25996]SUA93813.1 Uncharacterised protein [Neisseria mucosa]